MKRQYNKPENLVVHLSSHTLMVLSWDEFDKGEGDFDPGNMTYVKEEHTFTNRNVWDEEW